MSDIVARLTPTTYEPARIALYQNAAGDIVAEADFTIRNADGVRLETDHPAVVLTAGEQATFLAWFVEKLAQYEAATGLARWGAP